MTPQSRQGTDRDQDILTARPSVGGEARSDQGQPLDVIALQRAIESRRESRRILGEPGVALRQFARIGPDRFIEAGEVTTVKSNRWFDLVLRRIGHELTGTIAGGLRSTRWPLRGASPSQVRRYSPGADPNPSRIEPQDWIGISANRTGGGR